MGHGWRTSMCCCPQTTSRVGLSLTENAVRMRCNSTEPIGVYYYTTFTYPNLLVVSALSIGAGSFYRR